MQTNYLSIFSDFSWNMALYILMGGGIYLLLLSKFKPMFGILHAIKLLRGKVKHEEANMGQISHFAALMNALSATIGMGNIAGVAVAITQGGPGAIFWMWVSAFIGMNTKFFECTLALMYRGKDYQNQVQGGAMYVIDKTLGPKWKGFAIFFAFCALGGTLSIFNVNQITSYMNHQFAIPKMYFGIFLVILTGYIVLGGMKRVASASSKIVPSMCLLYIFSCLLILFVQRDAILSKFFLIFSEAFNPQAAGGGVLGYGVMRVMQIGVRRAAFSNEAGIGTAPMAHSNANTSEPVAEGLVAMLGPLIDTIIVCTMTALVILVSLPLGGNEGKDGILLTVSAFDYSLPIVGKYLLGICIFFFSFSSIFGFANHNKKCWDYLFKGKKYLGDKSFLIYYLGAIFLSAQIEMKNVLNFLDLCGALMILPNMGITLYKSKEVIYATEVYFKKFVQKIDRPR